MFPEPKVSRTTPSKVGSKNDSSCNSYSEIIGKIENYPEFTWVLVKVGNMYNIPTDSHKFV